MARRFLVPTWVLAALLAGLLFAGLLFTPLATAQDETAKEPPAAEPPAQKVDPATPATPDASPAQNGAEAEFQAKFADWKALIKHLRQLRSDFQTAEPEKMDAMNKDWEMTVAKAEKMLPDLIDTVVAAYQAAPNEDRVKVNFLAKIVTDYVARDLYEPALEIGSVLIENDCDLPEVYRDTGTAAFAMNDYKRTTEFLDKAAKLNALTGDAAMLREQLSDYEKFWKEEQELRAKEAKADDLPRVKLTTNKGEIVIELFENEAPETVGNFIKLVKDGYYDKLTFHRVISGFMAQGGCPQGDGTGGPGYTIYDECSKPGFRKHFRGVLSMAKTNAPNSAGSQFFITFRPTPHLNGQHTVFGRVIEGMDVVTSLQRRDPSAENAPEADRIIKAEVLRDRGHEYLPHKVE